MSTNIHHTFSPRLIAKAQRIFKQRCGIDLDVGRAEMILEQLAKVGNLALQLLEIYKKKNKQ